MLKPVLKILSKIFNFSLQNSHWRNLIVRSSLQRSIHTVSESHTGNGGKSNHGLELHSERENTSEGGNPKNKKKLEVSGKGASFILMIRRIGAGKGCS